MFFELLREAARAWGFHFGALVASLVVLASGRPAWVVGRTLLVMETAYWVVLPIGVVLGCLIAGLPLRRPR